MSIVRKQFDVTVKTIDEAARTVTALVSNPGLDRDGERILPGAFTQDLDTFRRNAVHLWGHNAMDLRCVLGRAIDVQVTPDGLLVTFEYAVEANPDAAIAFGLVKSGALSAYSVGFIPVEWVIPSETVMPEFIGAKRVYTRVKLVEISLVAIPSNPEALVVGRQMDAVSERSTPMNGHITDAAVRLRNAADQLEKANEDAEAIEAVAAILSAVCTDLLAFAEGVETNEEHEETEPAEEAAAEGEAAPEKSAHGLQFKSGAVLSASNRKRLSKIYKTCKEAMEHCRAMASEAGADVESEDEDEKSGDGRDNGDGVGATNHEPTSEEQNAGKAIEEPLTLVDFWERMKRA